jgi:hypothetical protein
VKGGKVKGLAEIGAKEKGLAEIIKSLGTATRMQR